mgnify:FL=1
MPILLELFCGTKIIGKAFEARGWHVFSVDIDPKAEPSLVADVSTLRLEDLPMHVDCIWASPPCTHYSRARTKAKTPRDLEGSDALVRKVLSIIKHFEEPDYFIENPHSGLMKTREVISGIPMCIVDYCKYGKPYRKRTSIWTNTSWEPSRPLCKHDCAASEGNKHTRSAQQGPARSTDSRYSLNELYSLPPELCDEIVSFVWP